MEPQRNKLKVDSDSFSFQQDSSPNLQGFMNNLDMQTSGLNNGMMAMDSSNQFAMAKGQATFMNNQPFMQTTQPDPMMMMQFFPQSQQPVSNDFIVEKKVPMKREEQGTVQDSEPFSKNFRMPPSYSNQQQQQNVQQSYYDTGYAPSYGQYSDGYAVQGYGQSGYEQVDSGDNHEAYSFRQNFSNSNRNMVQGGSPNLNTSSPSFQGFKSQGKDQYTKKGGDKSTPQKGRDSNTQKPRNSGQEKKEGGRFIKKNQSSYNEPKGRDTRNDNRGKRKETQQKKGESERVKYDKYDDTKYPEADSYKGDRNRGRGSKQGNSKQNQRYSQGKNNRREDEYQVGGRQETNKKGGRGRGRGREADSNPRQGNREQAKNRDRDRDRDDYNRGGRGRQQDSQYEKKGNSSKREGYNDSSGRDRDRDRDGYADSYKRAEDFEDGWDRKNQNRRRDGNQASNQQRTSDRGGHKNQRDQGGKWKHDGFERQMKEDQRSKRDQKDYRDQRDNKAGNNNRRRNDERNRDYNDYDYDGYEDSRDYYPPRDRGDRQNKRRSEQDRYDDRGGYSQNGGDRNRPKNDRGGPQRKQGRGDVEGDYSKKGREEERGGRNNKNKGRNDKGQDQNYQQASRYQRKEEKTQTRSKGTSKAETRNKNSRNVDSYRSKGGRDAARDSGAKGNPRNDRAAPKVDKKYNQAVKTPKIGDKKADANPPKSKTTKTGDKDKNKDTEAGFYEQEANTYYVEKAKHDVSRLSNSKEYSVLMVAEKPSIAKSIAEALGTRGQVNFHKGRSPTCPIHSFTGQIFGKKARIKVTSVAGHLFNRDFPKQYSNWVRTDPLTLFDAETIKTQANPKQRLIQHLRTEGKGSDFLVLWLDNDREGENICFEVQGVVRPVMNRNSFKQIYRSVFSSLAPKDLNAAYKSLHKGPNALESMSVDARQILDLKIGVAFSRFQCLYFSQKYANLNNRLITYGPCQTPTLSFCVERHFEIKNFKPEKFYTVRAEITCAGQKVFIPFKTDRRLKKGQAESLKEEIGKIPHGKILSITKKVTKRGRPGGLNTVDMLKHASSKMAMGPHHTMIVAERLYLSGFITYPRTESTHYSSNFDFEGVVKNLSESSAGSQEMRNYASQLIKNGFNTPKKGVDVGDHPPITPSSKPPGGLTDEEYRLYNFITRRFLASISQDAELIKTKVTLEFGPKHKFFLDGLIVQKEGYLSIADWENPGESGLHEFKEGASAQIDDLMLQEGLTKPPDYITESDLISKLEKYGIGTDASMASHINNICERNYVNIAGGRKLVPSDLGIALVSGYKAVVPELVAPDLRSTIEGSCSKIANGQSKFEDVLKESTAIFKLKFMEFRNNVEKMDQFFAKSFTSFNLATNSNKYCKPFSKCGKCQRYMDLMKDFGKLKCDICDDTYELPKSSKYLITSEFRCPVDNFQVFSYVRDDSEARSILFQCCPFCYNSYSQTDLDIEDAVDEADGGSNEDNEDDETAVGDITRILCSHCPTQGCKFTPGKHIYDKCTECEKGDRLFHPSTKKDFYLICNNEVCLGLTKVAEKTKKITMLEEKCEKCERKKVKIETIKDHPTITDGVYEGCIMCDEEYKTKYINFEGANLFSNKFFGRRRGGRRGGRGGRGRGRGRGGRGGRGRGRGGRGGRR